MIVVVAEKPSVAREIAAVVGASVRKNGYLEGNGYCVTWALGHLVRLSEPGEMNPAWGAWRSDILPMLPEHWMLTIIERNKAQYQIVKRLMCASSTREVICATDAGREGELIFRYVYELTGCTRPVRRLWISSLTESAIAAGLRQLKPASAFEGLAVAARLRSRADWLVGMNLSRAYQMGRGKPTSVGRVQTPTLAFVVARDRAIAAFVPKRFRQLHATFGTPSGGTFDAVYERSLELADGTTKFSSFLPVQAQGLAPEHNADLVLAATQAGRAEIARVEGSTEAERPPQLFDLTTLQRTANRLWGWTAAQTLQVAQSLYEAKLLSYPRTDSRYLSSDVAVTTPRIVDVIAPFYEGLVRAETGRSALGKRFVDDQKVSDHHAIIPTGTEPRSLEPGTEGAMLFDLVCRRFLQAWQEDLQLRRTEIVVLVRGADRELRFAAKGTTVLRAGWKALELRAAEAKADVELPVGLTPGLTLRLESARIREDKTRPPPHLTESELLRTLETAGCGLSDELAEAMKDKGLGTPATRAAIIETLLSRGYVTRSGKALCSTSEGVDLIDSVDAHVCSAAMTAEMEEKLRRIERNEGSPAAFMAELEEFVRARVHDALKNGVAPRAPRPIDSARPRVASKAGTKTKAKFDRGPRARAVKGKPA
ncbi:MAG: topoisomerase [Myxococcaceae bacterium]|nr:topoisomerase [Myxococcaceae bacterium]